MPDMKKQDARRQDAAQDEAVAETFPASDPPASMSSGGARAVPAEAMMERADPVAGAVTLRRGFADAEAAKLALEALVRDGPVDRAATEIRQAGSRFELVLQAPPGDAERLRRLLEAA